MSRAQTSSFTSTAAAASVADTVERLVVAIESRGAKVFTRIDHGAAARAAGLELGDEVAIVFGDPHVGTLLMQVDARVGYELPLRLLVWDEGSGTQIGYADPVALAERYDLAEQRPLLERMRGLLAGLAVEAA